MTRYRWALVGLGVAFFVYTVAAARVGFSPYDDGVFGYGGWSVAHGRLPYRDFWTLYNPGQFLILGAFFRFVGASVLALRIFESAVVAGCGLLAFDVVRRVYGNRPVGVAASSLLVLWLGAGSALYPFHENHTLSSLFLLLLSADFLLIGVVDERSRWAAMAGVAAGACFVIRQDAAPYVMFPELVALLALPLFTGKPWRSCARRALAFIGGAAVPIAAMLAWVLSYAPHEYWAQAVMFPLRSNPGLRDLPYSFSPLVFSTSGGPVEAIMELARSAREGFFYYLPFLVAAFGLALVIAHVRGRRRMKERPEEAGAIPNMWGFALLSLLLLVSLDYSRVRSDFEHIFGSVLLGFLVAPGVVMAVASTVRSTAARKPAIVAGALVAVFAVLIPVGARLRVMQAMDDGPRLSSGLLSGIVIDNRDNGASSDWEVIDEAARYVAANTAADEKIFVTGARNDRLIFAYPSFYLLAARPAGTTNAELYPGVTTVAPAQRRMIAELDGANVRYVVRWPIDDDGCIEPNAACTRPGSRLLDDYIDDTYAQVARYDGLDVLIRR